MVSILRFLRAGLRGLLRRPEVDQELDDELKHYLELSVEENRRAGMSAEAAERAARVRMGGVEQARIEVRTAGWEFHVETVWRDLTHAWRSLARSPVFAVIVIATLAIGIGANTAALGIIDAALFRGAPVPRPDEVVWIRCVDTSNKYRTANQSACSFPEWRELTDLAPGLNGLAAYALAQVRLGGDLAGLQLASAFVTGNYFSVFGLRPARGRYIQPDESEIDDPRPVVVISDYLWRNTFESDKDIVGRPITIGSTVFTIIGVAPFGFAGFHLEGRTDLWLPYASQPLAVGRDDYRRRDARPVWTPMVGRLRPGVTLAEIQGALENATRELALRHPETNAKTAYRASDRQISAAGMANALSIFGPAWFMIALVHMVACSSVAGLMLARAARRRRELGIRLCLGASRTRIALQALAEPVLLGLLGAIGGVVMTRWFTGLATSMWFLSALDRGADARVVAIVVVVAAATVLVFGVTPALASARQDPMDVLRSASAASPGLRPRGDALIIAVQSGLSLILAAQAMLLVGKYTRDSAAPLGYEQTNLVSARIQLRNQHTLPGDWVTMYQDATRRAAALPGVAAVAVTDAPPLSFGSWKFEEITVPDHAYQPDEGRQVALGLAGPAYFATIGAQLRSGREFTTGDRHESGDARRRGFNVAIVNETFARRYWGERDPVGKSLQHGTATVRIVGVVRDIHDLRLSFVPPRVYFPLLESAYPALTIVARVNGDPEAVAARLRGTLESLPGIDPPSVRTIGDARADHLSTPRYLGLAVGACAGLALLLTAMGLYGAVAMWAAARRTELGIRLALGAKSRHVYVALLSNAGKLVGGGVAAGALGAFGLMRLEQFRYGASLAFQPIGLAAAATVFGAVTLAAAWLPARRAVRMSPADVLRSD